MTIRRYLAPLLATLLTTAGAADSRAEYLFRGLGTLGGDYTSVQAVSADGSVVVGWSRNPDGDGRAFRWQDGAMAAVGDRTDTSASAVSAGGSVIMINRAGGAFRWEDGVVVQLPTGPATLGSASDLSAGGAVIVGGATTYWFDPGEGGEIYEDAVVWGPPDDEGNYPMRFLKSLVSSGNRREWASGVSADGSVIVGSAQNASDHFQAVRWEGSQVLALGTLGGLASGARDVSAEGSVIVGWAERADGLEEPFRWENDTMVGLGILAGDWEWTGANAVSADGSVVVGYARTEQFDFEPFIWDQPHGIRSLSEVLTNNGIDLSDWDLETAADISADGTVIVGNGYHISAGRSEGWIATIPEPSTLAGLLTMGGALLLAQLWRRRRRVGEGVREGVSP